MKNTVRSQSHFTTDGQSVRLGVDHILVTQKTHDIYGLCRRGASSLTTGRIYHWNVYLFIVAP
jgi:hypothetical protein